ncbi:hypothetical protein WR25_15140 [Diploscapter pachys]|uniref:Uncharacterized protein n=1 Tax=Diploscapter pachys TaxID=2018661 RepID=A0A2A2K483_9BILA|nr:hypothetical protein WR25_15140 [Diploscapter pachys]
MNFFPRWLDTNGDGPSGETSPDFNDFKPFGGWQSPCEDVQWKQYARNEQICGLTLNKNTGIVAISGDIGGKPSPLKASCGEFFKRRIEETKSLQKS